MYSQFTKPTMLIPFHDAASFLKEELAADCFSPHPAALAGNGIDIRLDWSGGGTRLGRFEVKGPHGTWEQCRNLAPHMDANDLIYPASQVDGEKLIVRFQRGPEYPALLFKVRALPIRWYDGHEPEPARALPSTYEAVRYTDYEYDISEHPDKEEQWQVSSASGTDSLQCFTLELRKGRDYEVWVTLQNPNDPDDWLPHDPIIRPDSGNSGNAPPPPK